MQDVPKIVLKRLQETAGVMASVTASENVHPDADLLTAFAEQSLDGSERAGVMEHLARCADCREVVAFALPATEAVAVTVSTSARSRWSSWPVLRWSVVAAGLLAVTSFGVLQYKQGQVKSKALGSVITARNEASATAAQSLPPSPNVEPESRAALPQAENRRQTEIREKTPSSTQDIIAADKSVRPPNSIFPEPHATGSAGSGVGIGGGIGSGSGGGYAPQVAQPSVPRESLAFAPASKDAMNVATAKQSAAPAANPPPMGSGASQMVEVQSDAAPVATAENNVTDQLIHGQTEQSSQKQLSTNSGVVKAKALAPTQAAVGGPSLALAPPSVSLQTAPALMLRASPRWTISAVGALQRSFDAGETWEEVNVNAAAAVSRSQVAIVGGDLEKSKKKEHAQPNPVFRVVTAIGSEVWAGGSGAMLYHSGDSGTHWTRILPSSAVAMLTGDITGIEFSDPQHGSVATSTGELWITADEGQTWRQQ
jgi:Photosynthesis system II assembly factor YCF48/Putative zinc-finger